MMMLCNRTRKLPFNALSNFAFTLPSQDSIFPPTSTILSSKGPNFTTIFTPFSSISKTLVNTKRFYSVHPPPPTTPTPTDDDEAPISLKDALEWYYAKSLETVPYTNRTRRIIFPRDIERLVSEADFKKFKEKLMQNEGMLLSPTHPDVVWVKSVFNGIIDALQRDLKKMGNATSSYDSIAERILMSIIRKAPPASTSHLDGLDWEVFVVKNDPDIPLISFCYCYSLGKIVVCYDLVSQYVESEIEIAVIISLLVARIVARHEGEKLSKERRIGLLSFYLGENFTKHIGIRIRNLTRRLPLNRRFDVEAKYIGHQILVSAGYDPKEVAKVYEKIGIEMTRHLIKD